MSLLVGDQPLPADWCERAVGIDVSSVEQDGPFEIMLAVRREVLVEREPREPSHPEGVHDPAVVIEDHRALAIPLEENALEVVEGHVHRGAVQQDRALVPHADRDRQALPGREAVTNHPRGGRVVEYPQGAQVGVEGNDSILPGHRSGDRVDVERIAGVRERNAAGEKP